MSAPSLARAPLTLVVVAVMTLVMGSASTPAAADTFAMVKRTCQLCDTGYEMAVTASGTIWSRQLDGRPIGAFASPPRIGTCPSCGFVDFRHGNPLAAKELTVLRAFVRSDAYTKLAASEVPYFRVARMQHELGAAPADLCRSYLFASWEASDRRHVEQAARYRLACLEACERVLAQSAGTAEQQRYHRLLKGELLRRLARFDEAQLHLEKLSQAKEMNHDCYPDLIRLELELVARKNSDSHEVPPCASAAAPAAPPPPPSSVKPPPPDPAATTPPPPEPSPPSAPAPPPSAAPSQSAS